MTAVLSQARTKLADEVWMVTALLHREHPERTDFTVDEIVDRARREKIIAPLRSGFYVHVVQHCVANRPPNPGRYRMLFETAPGRRRLFHNGDAYDPAREGSKITPLRDDLPEKYADLLEWYRHWSEVAANNSRQADPLLALRGSGKQLWAKEHADEYVRRLRAGWE